MKPINVMILILATLFFCSELTAQNRNDRGIGRGRFLKRLRDDLSSANRSQQNQQKRKTPTPAVKGKTPTLATKARSSKNRQSQSRSSTRGATKNGPTSRDFGMMVAKSQGGGFVVARIVTNGNASQAGVRRGDLIVEVGGSKLETIEEIDSIAEVLDQGDQIEFTIQSKGSKPRKVMIQYGIAPEVDGETVEIDGNGVIPGMGEKGMKSVLDEPVAQSVTGAGKQPKSTGYQTANSQTLNRTVNQQRRQIRQLQQQLRRFRNDSQRR